MLKGLVKDAAAMAAGLAFEVVKKIAAPVTDRVAKRAGPTPLDAEGSESESKASEVKSSAKASESPPVNPDEALPMPHAVSPVVAERLAKGPRAAPKVKAKRGQKHAHHH